MMDLRARVVLRYAGQIVAKTVYHGTWQVDLSEVVPDPSGEQKMSTLGTWFTSNPVRAKDYGPNIYEIELPDVDFMTARTEDFNRFWFDYDLARKHLKLDPKVLEVVDAWVHHQPLPKTSLSKRLMSGNTDYEIAVLLRGMFRNWSYLTDFRSKIQSKGYQGIVWPNSTIDGSPRHDVYLYFGKAKVTPKLRSVSSTLGLPTR
jgi:hypothetical protein